MIGHCGPNAGTAGGVWWGRSRWLALAAALFVLMALHARHGQWSGDFWEHCAVVKELATHPLRPEHPQLLTSAPHAFSSPYTLSLGFVSRLAQRSVVDVLAVAGLVNYVLLIAGLALTATLCAPRAAAAVKFYALVFAVFLWAQPWSYSGILSVRVLGYVLPYPSIFATALTLLLIPLGVHALRRPSWWAAVLLAVGGWVVLLSHPLTFLLLATGWLCFAWAETRGRSYRRLWALGLLGVVLVAGLLWPYYPLGRLLLGELHVYHSNNRVMYDRVLWRIWPAVILGLPFLVQRWRVNRRDPLVALFFCLLAIYGFGYATRQYGFGRVVSHLVLVLHLAAAAGLANWEAGAKSGAGRLAWRAWAPMIPALGLCAWLSHQFVDQAVDRARHGVRPTSEPYVFLTSQVGQYEVVLAETSPAFPVPCLAGKLVAAAHPLAFVEDHDQRKQDVASFFDPKTSTETRQEILWRYEVNYILVRRDGRAEWRQQVANLEPLAGVVCETDQFVLLSVTERQGPAPRGAD